MFGHFNWKFITNIERTQLPGGRYNKGWFEARFPERSATIIGWEDCQRQSGRHLSTECFAIYSLLFGRRWLWRVNADEFQGAAKENKPFPKSLPFCWSDFPTYFISSPQLYAFRMDHTTKTWTIVIMLCDCTVFHLNVRWKIDIGRFRASKHSKQS